MNATAPAAEVPDCKDCQHFSALTTGGGCHAFYFAVSAEYARAPNHACGPTGARFIPLTDLQKKRRAVAEDKRGSA